MRSIYIALIFLLYIQPSKNKKIGGVNFVGPPNPVNISSFSTLKNINAQWVAFNPFGYTPKNSHRVNYDVPGYWWGESTKGTKALISFAKQKNIKVMLKPHVWVVGQGWPGDFKPNTGSEWRIWETDYHKYIMTLAKIAAKNEVEIFCIGTEYRHAVKERPRFWVHLIRSVKELYKGDITYAANWDNYKNVPFWNLLDYVGIDAYFPLSNKETATVSELNKAWSPIKDELEEYSSRVGKPILFTEYGYKSIDNTTWKQWELPNQWDKGNPNLTAQVYAYKSIFNTFWKEDWFAGGFLWKWYADTTKGGTNNSDYTPQKKPVEKTIKKWYGN